MRVAVVGAAPSAALAPYRDPSWQVWALPWRNRTPGIARFFEMHDRARWPTGDHGERYLARLRALTVPVAMIRQHPDIPTSEPYPLAMVADCIGRDYFASSIAYMVALAVTERADEIGLWGVDMDAEDEYRQQRPNLEWLLGLAEGRGIRVTLPEGCPLLSSPRYGA